MLYSCTHMTTVGVRGLTLAIKYADTMLLYPSWNVTDALEAQQDVKKCRQ